MNSRCTRLFLISALLLSLSTGCNSRNDRQPAANSAPGSGPSVTGTAGDIKTISGQNTTGATTASPQDQADARAAVIRINSQLEAGDFAAIYRNASPGFQKIGPEAQFVNKFTQTRQKTGPLANLREISFTTRPDKIHVLIYRLDNGRFTSDRRFSFSRQATGTMILEGLNQHDEPGK